MGQSLKPTHLGAYAGDDLVAPLEGAPGVLPPKVPKQLPHLHAQQRRRLRQLGVDADVARAHQQLGVAAPAGVQRAPARHDDARDLDVVWVGGGRAGGLVLRVSGFS
jgi:hypothetical protein